MKKEKSELERLFGLIVSIIVVTQLVIKTIKKDEKDFYTDNNNVDGDNISTGL